jgi:hypothetical protein
MSTTIIVLPIKIISPDPRIRATIQDLSLPELYTIFSHLPEPQQLHARYALQEIITFEEEEIMEPIVSSLESCTTDILEILDSVTGFKSSTLQWKPELTKIYADLFSQDEYIWGAEKRGERQDILTFILLHEGRYRGHIHTWREPNVPQVTHIVGIRTSLVDLLSEAPKPKIAAPLLAAIKEIAAKRGDILLRVYHPYPVMAALLGKWGFHTLTGRENPIPVGSREELSLPEWASEEDMVLRISEELHFPTPSYSLEILQE